MAEIPECVDQPFDSESTGNSEDADLVPIHSVEDWITLLDDDLSQPSTVASDSFRIYLGRNMTLARLSHRFYWSRMSNDVK